MSDERLAHAKALLSRLVAFDSVSPASNLPIIDFVQTYLAAQGVAERQAPNDSGDKATILAPSGHRIPHAQNPQPPAVISSAIASRRPVVRADRKVDALSRA
jgi:acetylornithine deacetylase/succinyl-diaminopimelate desuccinylase-like protein